MLRLSIRTLQRLNQDGTGPRKLQMTERRVAYRHADLVAWIAQRKTSEAMPLTAA
jgi:predicted DNA-binding transcriptional regulator AlpA